LLTADSFFADCYRLTAREEEMALSLRLIAFLLTARKLWSAKKRSAISQRRIALPLWLIAVS
jgi:hypothetical protein